MRGLQELFSDWPFRFHGATADGFFKIVIRRAPTDKDVWGWALEWNHSHRVVGFLGDEDATREYLADIPTCPRRELFGGTWRYRKHQSLPDEEDRLFQLPQ